VERTKTNPDKTFQTKDPLTKPPDKNPRKQLRQNLYKGAFVRVFCRPTRPSKNWGVRDVCHTLWTAPICLWICCYPVLSLEIVRWKFGEFNYEPMSFRTSIGERLNVSVSYLTLWKCQGMRSLTCLAEVDKLYKQKIEHHDMSFRM